MKRLPKIWLLAAMLIMSSALVQYGVAQQRFHQEETNGTIADVLPGNSTFVITGKNGERQRFELDEDPVILINDVEATLENVAVGDRVHVVYRLDEASLLASEVRCKR